jgi:hypothetical protein
MGPKRGRGFRPIGPPSKYYPAGFIQAIVDWKALPKGERRVFLHAAVPALGIIAALALALWGIVWVITHL